MRRASYFLLFALVLSCIVVGSQPAEGASRAPAAMMVVEMVRVPITVNDIVYDWQRDRLLASVSGDQGELGNSIVPIDPSDGVQEPVFIGSEPNVLALSADGDSLYVGLDGAAAVRRLHLTTMTADPQWPVGTTPQCGLLLVEDMVVLTDDPDAVAVARRSDGCWPSWYGVAVYDGGVMRSITTGETTLHNQIEPSSDPNVLFSMDTETSGAEFHRLVVTPEGVSIAATVLNPFACASFVQAGGELFSPCGPVVDETTMAPLGQFEPTRPGGEFIVVAPDPVAGRTFFISALQPYFHSELNVYDRATFRKITTALLLDFGSQGQDTPVELIHAGPNRLALRTAGGGVYWLNYELLANSIYLPTIQRGLWQPGDE